MVVKIISQLYGALSGLNRFLYRSGLRQIQTMPGFVISAGNICAGGAGKTAFVIDLCVMLRGIKKTAVITRGYKGKMRGPAEVKDGAGAVENFGDEAVMMAKKLPGTPIVVSKNRIEGIKFARKKFKSEVFILDDAFQNFTMEKDRDIVIIDALAPWKGLMREGKNSLKRSDIIVISKSNLAEGQAVEELKKEIRSFTDALIISSALNLAGLVNIKTSERVPKETLKDKGLGAFCGLGKPDSFRKFLEKNGLSFKKFISFGDHHKYRGKDIKKLDKNLIWLTTAKDAVKLKDIYADILSVETASAYSEDILNLIFPGGGKNKAVILDRDGTLNEDSGYTCEIKDLKFLPGTIPALKKLADNGFLLIIVSNQSGIGRGYFSRRKADKFNASLVTALAEKGIKISGVYICPHTPEDNCACRKPGSLLFEKAVSDFGIDVSRSFCIGDMERDIISGNRLKIKGILLGQDFKNLSDAADYIIQTENLSAADKSIIS
ncbi:tetraacyldisaccharide 4'-kinase [bacterium]|nr:tetraacyldisaccharide 4'-kinase [bacterium]MBU3956467.1 tetraacyldisaccharide 4'-kinase [bacterium]MBU4133763.1 tetraacyldisaccharide 4'-kinase [bacterium]